MVGAATILPLGAYVIAFNVISDRTKACRYGPLYVHCLAQPDQYASVCARAASASAPKS